jgi:uncharacterized protein
MNVEKAKTYISDELRKKLDPTLYYHGFHHTLDVVDAALFLAKSENITDQESLKLLETAAFYHDSGFLNVYKGHEDAGCAIAASVLPDLGYSKEQIEIICGLIRATRIPQTPQNHLERIICDADLDYLGRDDFEPISATLFEELKVRDIVNDLNAWNKIQIGFISDHHYWTNSAKQMRDASKQKHLENLKAITVLS